MVQLTCDVPREDLSGRDGFGNGRHAFRYRPDPPLTGPHPLRVTVRGAATGKLLGNGDAVLSPGLTEQPPDFGADLLPGFQVFPAPETPRQTFDMLSLYDRSQGLYNLLRQMDFNGRSARQAAYAVLGRHAPHTDKAPSPWHSQAARDLLNDLLLSLEFQQNILRLFLEAFPEKRRLLFVHIPKCAGSDLSYHLVGRYPSIPEQLRALRWTEKRLLFDTLSETVRRLRFSDTIFVRGHVNLGDYLKQGLARPFDRLFTILRDPVASAISQVNYILTRLKIDAAAGEFQPDTIGWVPLLQLDEVPRDLSDELLCRVGQRALRRPDIVMANPMCHWLGGGDAAAVLARLAEHEVEVTTVRHYPRWRRQRWGIEANTRQNESMKFLTQQTIGPEDLAYLREMSMQDIALYHTVELRLLRTGECSVTDWSQLPPEDAGAVTVA